MEVEGWCEELAILSGVRGGATDGCEGKFEGVKVRGEAW